MYYNYNIIPFEFDLIVNQRKCSHTPFAVAFWVISFSPSMTIVVPISMNGTPPGFTLYAKKTRSFLYFSLPNLLTKED